MREEINEVKRIREQITKKEEQTPKVIDFVRQKFDGIVRFRLSEVKTSYRVIRIYMESS